MGHNAPEMGALALAPGLGAERGKGASGNGAGLRASQQADRAGLVDLHGLSRASSDGTRTACITPPPSPVCPLAGIVLLPRLL